MLDFDAHPPDGLAACFAGDRSVHLASISGSDWGPLPGVDDKVLPAGAGDDQYLAALDALLGRLPPFDLAFVIAGGDVLAGDRLGCLGLTLEGARNSDRRVATALDGLPAVWPPGGGYTGRSWMVLAGSGMVLARGSLTRIPQGYDPLWARFSNIARHLSPDLLGETDITRADIQAIH